MTLFGLLLLTLFTPISASALLILAFSFYSGHELWWKRRRLPPGPTPWLLAGNMPQILLMSTLGGISFEKVFVRWKQRYGPIFTFWMGPIPMVMVGEVELMKREPHVL